MDVQSDSGLSLKDDIASIWKDTSYHDVTIVCADGVEIGACRAVLAARCPVFKAMLYGNMQESISQRVILQDINSQALTVVLGFIYTESIDTTTTTTTTTTIAVDIYYAASFLLLPKLMAMVLERAQDISDFGVSSSLLNGAAASIPWSEVSKDLYTVLLRPFYARKLAIGELTELSKEAIELLFTALCATSFVTSEYDLLLCIVDWVWARAEEPGPDVAKRHAVLRDVASMVPGCEGKIRLKNDSLLNMMKLLDLTLVCPHRLKNLTEAVEGLAETSPHYMAFCHHACKNTACLTGHPSGYRGCRDLQWDRSKVGSHIVVSDDGKVVALPVGTPINMRQTARISVPGTTTHEGLCEWDIVVESVGLYDGNVSSPISEIGLVGEDFASFDTCMQNRSSAWEFQSLSNSYRRLIRVGESRDYGIFLRSGDVVTLHLDKRNHTCAFSINGINHGIAWTDLPEKMYPAVTLSVLSKYRIKDRYSYT